MDMNYRGGLWEGRGWAGWSGAKGGKWDNCNSTINIFKNKQKIEENQKAFKKSTKSLNSKN